MAHDHPIWSGIPRADELPTRQHKMARAFELGVLYARGEVFPFDERLASKWLLEALACGHPLAQAELNNLFEKMKPCKPVYTTDPTDKSRITISHGDLKKVQKATIRCSNTNRAKPIQPFALSSGWAQPLSYADKAANRIFKYGFYIGMDLFDKQSDAYRRQTMMRSIDFNEETILEIQSRCMTIIETVEHSTKALDRLKNYIDKHKSLSFLISDITRLEMWMHQGINSAIDCSDEYCMFDAAYRDVSHIIERLCQMGYRLSKPNSDDNYLFNKSKYAERKSNEFNIVVIEDANECVQ